MGLLLLVWWCIRHIIPCRIELRGSWRFSNCLCLLFKLNIKSNFSDSRPCATDVLITCKQPTTTPDQESEDQEPTRGAEHLERYDMYGAAQVPELRSPNGKKPIITLSYRPTDGQGREDLEVT